MGKFGKVETVVDNPFTPNFGITPTHQVGHEELLHQLSKGFSQGPRAEGFTPMLLGPRGSGKTIMLQAIQDIAYDDEWIVLPIEAGKTSLRDSINEAIQDSYRGKRTTPLLSAKKETIRKGTSIKLGPIKWHKEAIQEISTEAGTRTNLGRLAEHADKHNVGVMLTVDEIHSGNRQDLRDLALDIQSLTKRKELPLAFIGAGLLDVKHTLLADQKITFLQRCPRYEMPLLSAVDIQEGLVATIQTANGTISDEALDILSNACGPLPFHMQLLGSHAWELADAPSNTINAKSAVAAVEAARRDMYARVFLPSWGDLSEHEQTYLRVLSELGGEASCVSLAGQIGLGRTNLSRVEDRLVGIGYVEYAQIQNETHVRMTRLMSAENINQHVTRGNSADAMMLVNQGVLPLNGKETCAADMPRVYGRCILKKGHKGRHRSR